MTRNSIIVMMVSFFSIMLVGNTRADQGNWKQLKNKFSWEIQYPQCWKALVVASDDLDVKRAPLITIAPAEGCKKDNTEGLAVHINVSMYEKVDTPDSQLASAIQNSKENNIEYAQDSILLKPHQAKMIFRRFGNLAANSPLELNWTVYTMCAGKNLNYTLTARVPKEDKDKPLSKQKMPEVLKKITETFVCTKP